MKEPQTLLERDQHILSLASEFVGIEELIVLMELHDKFKELQPQNARKGEILKEIGLIPIVTERNSRKIREIEKRLDKIEAYLRKPFLIRLFTKLP